MIRKIALFAGGDLDTLGTDFDLFVGVDAGSLFVLDNGLSLDLAVGDFDSVSPSQWERIESQATEVYRAPAEKDDTDLELALKLLLQCYPEAKLTVFGAMGGRVDHFLSNLFLASEPELAPFMEQIELAAKDNWVAYRPAGRHQIDPMEGMTYISFVPSDGSRLTIQNAKYLLNEENFFFKKCYSSNEFVDGPITIELDQGYVVILYSRDRS